MKKLSRPTIGILFLGGSTIEGTSRQTTTVASAGDVAPWLELLPELDIIASVKGFFIGGGRTPIGVAEWQNAAAIISKHYAEVDGFVVIHELESLPAGAMALSLMLQHLQKPVVVVGSPLSASSSPSDLTHSWLATYEYGAKASFINAIQVALSDAAEVIVVFGSHLLRGTTVVSQSLPQGSKLEGQVLGKIDFGIRFFGQQQRRHHRPLRLATTIETQIHSVEFVPGMSIEQMSANAPKSKGLFLSSHEAWSGLMSALPLIRKKLPTPYPIGLYHPHTSAPPGVLSVPGVSRTNALILFMWALGQSRNHRQVQKLLEKYSLR